MYSTFFLQFTCQNITHLSMSSHRAFMIYKYTYLHRCEKKRCSRLLLLRLINIDNYFAFSIFKPSSNLFVLKKFFISFFLYTVDSRYLEFHGTLEKIRVNRSSTQEELRRYRKCGLFNNERETTRAKF